MGSHRRSASMSGVAFELFVEPTIYLVRKPATVTTLGSGRRLYLIGWTQ